MQKIEKKMEMYYEIRIHLQLAIQKPFREGLEYTTFLHIQTPTPAEIFIKIGVL